MADTADLPGDFITVPVNYPVDVDRQLGYAGSARFVGFFWDQDEDDAACVDGQSAEPVAGDWQAYVKYIAPLGPYFRANLGSSDEQATHLVVWDRAQHACYIAPRESAERFFKNQHTPAGG